MLGEVTHGKVSSPAWEELVRRFGGGSVLVFGPQETGPLGSHVRPGPLIGELSAETGRELLSFWGAQRIEDRDRGHFTGSEADRGGVEWAAASGQRGIQWGLPWGAGVRPAV